MENKENQTPKTKDQKTHIRVITEATKTTDVNVCADVTNYVTKTAEAVVEPIKDVVVEDIHKTPLLKQSDAYGLDSSSDSESESYLDSDTENEDRWKKHKVLYKCVTQ